MADYPMLLVTGAKSGTVSLLKVEMKTGERPNYDGSSCTLLTHVYLHFSPPPPPPLFFSFFFFFFFFFFKSVKCRCCSHCFCTKSSNFTEPYTGLFNVGCGGSCGGWGGGGGGGRGERGYLFCIWYKSDMNDCRS